MVTALIVGGCCSLDPYDDIENSDHSAKAAFEFTIKKENKSKLRLETVTGDITIIGSAPDTTITIAGVREVRSESEEDAREHLQDLQVQLTEAGQELLVKTSQPDKAHGRNYVVNYEIRCPSSLGVIVDHVTGRVELGSIENNVTLHVVNGNVVTRDVHSNVVINVTNGYIESEFFLPAGGNAEIQSVNGVIKAKIPRSTSAELSATVTNGQVAVSDLPLQIITHSAKQIRGVLGDGNGMIVVKTTNGDIHITRTD